MNVKTDKRRRAEIGPYGRRNAKTGKPELNEEGQRLVAEDFLRYPHPWVLFRASYPELYAAARIYYNETEIDAMCFQARTKAMVHFEPALGNEFNTYASWWMRSVVGRTVLVRSKANRAGKKELSLNYPVRNNEGREYGEFLSETDRVAADAERQRHNETLREMIGKLLRKVEPNAKRRNIYLYRNGFATGKTETLDDTATPFGMSRERVRQITAQIHRKLEPLLEELYHDQVSAAR